MNCTNCGEPLKPSDTFCPACGTGVGAPITSDAVIDPTGSDTDHLPPAAQLGRRAAARVLDILLLFAVLFIIALPFTDEVVNEDGDTVAEVDPIMALFAVIVVFAYEVGFVAWRAQTPGKIAMSIAVSDASTGDAPTFRQAVMRWLLLGVSWSLVIPVLGILGLVVMMLSYTSAFWDRGQQNWNDKVARTRIIAKTAAAARS
ncbi:MAG: RDD family protein [Actinomycetota bacterium]